MKNLLDLPENLPVPVDDGACTHLEGSMLPPIKLLSTSGQKIDLSIEPGFIVVYFYPMIGKPDSPPMIGWNEIPGARGCTPQSCAFRDHHSQLRAFGVTVYGASAQPFEDQKESADRLHLPFDLLNDASLEFTKALGLPTFEYNGRRLIKRLTLIVEHKEIRKVFYPVFPPNENAARVVEWLETQRA